MNRTAMEVEGGIDNPIFALEEQLARQKGILANRRLLQNLPDKGAKLRDAVTRLEADLERKRKEFETRQKRSIRDIGKLEWTLRDPSSSSNGDKQHGCKDEPLDSDDEMDEESNIMEEDVLKIIATSQITQRQPKPVVPDTMVSEHRGDSQVIASSITSKDVITDSYLVKLLEKDVRNTDSGINKFVPSKSLKGKEVGDVEGQTSTESSTPTAKKESRPKWDECLLPTPVAHAMEAVKIMSLEESIKISTDKFKAAEDLVKLEARTKKVYAWDKLKEQGLLGTYSVGMQTSRPVHRDVDEDEFDEDDISDDEITEESEPDESVDNKESESTSRDLSNLVNSTLKLS